ncbi:MAG: carboxypeptidase-like regulatory domain-containing protein [Acidobacteriia bacterium]|nr:carboxypeptidase-like regulatory domain-containing protein [Terriglobia bacterium]
MKPICRSVWRMMAWAIVAVLAIGPRATAKQQGYGTLSGVVSDPYGTPQMGATVWLISEDLGGRTVSQLLSNQYGAFVTDHLKPGSYSVRVSLAGFLPAMQVHVPVSADLTTTLRVRMNSVFASLDTLRRKPDATSETDDWKWVLRSSAATRTILQWRDTDPDFTATAASPEHPGTQRVHGLVQFTNGAMRPGSPSSLPDAPATTVSYEQPIGNLGRLLIAGQMSYERGASGSFASVWLPSGAAGRGPETVFVLHQSKFGVAGLAFQEMRFDQSQQIALSDRLSLRAGAEYVRAGFVSSVAALRPHARLDGHLAPGWSASFLVASNPPLDHWERAGALESAIQELDSLPTVLFHGGNPVLEGGWHEEFSIRHKLTSRAKIEVAAFHDSIQHQALFGSGPAATPDFVQDTFSQALLYDGGGANSWGTRVTYRRKIFDHLEVAGLYDWAGALTPSGPLDPASADFRNNIATRNHHSIAARVSGKVPRAGTQFAASYKWISGATLSRMDAFGEAESEMDPNLHLSIRQPLPGLNGRWVALADVSNALCQGYVSAGGQDSRIVLVPVFRAFRGGVSFQF